MKSFASFLKRAFPIPHILMLSDVSVSFFDGQLSFFEFIRSKGTLRPKACGTMPFPKLRREMREDPALFTEAGSALKDFASSRGYRFARVMVHEADAYVFKVNVPTIIPEEIESAVESALEENVPVSPSEAVFEYEIVHVDAVRGKTLVAVTVISGKILADYISLVETAGMMPVMFDTEARSIAKALIARDDKKSHAILTIKERHSVICVVEKGVVTFSSSIDVGSADIHRAVTKSAPSSADETAVFESMIPVFSTIHDELNKMLSYFKTESYRQSEDQIVDIILSGGDARLPGFAQYVSVTSKLPVKVGSVWTNILSPEKTLPELDEKRSLGYGALIGIHIE